VHLPLNQIFPEEARLGRGALEGRLAEALTGREGEARDLLADRRAIPVIL
jgi:hypothetical protein